MSNQLISVPSEIHSQLKLLSECENKSMSSIIKRLVENETLSKKEIIKITLQKKEEIKKIMNNNDN